MDLIIGTVTEAPGEVRFICETHSEQCVMRVRRRIAEGKIPFDSVKLVSVGHRSAEDEPPEPMRIIGFDEYGTPDAWPIGVFDEAFGDLACMQEANEKHLAREATDRAVAP
jgi:predicted ATPase